ncbi:hypothetical protein [Polymorphobacter megasporae]|uniref:hypothetical protein n=1 Tax=Glacieibacterium megasporae TaxID=2835787 RepID=UPI001C1E2F45|nr:hypothetical protein [Polymorphobacter megasporae]UAJ12711.1 hypothetical protein KTC28_19385 [Polymorphobacter megasporae]
MKSPNSLSRLALTARICPDPQQDDQLRRVLGATNGVQGREHSALRGNSPIKPTIDNKIAADIAWAAKRSIHIGVDDRLTSGVVLSGNMSDAICLK